MKNKKGFTLVELLVVVLIIGILAAIALPKYEMAVEKAHAVKAITAVKALSEATERYYMANGSYPGTDDTRQPLADINANLDIEMPAVPGFFIYQYKNSIIVAQRQGSSRWKYEISKTMSVGNAWSGRGLTCSTDVNNDTSRSAQLCKSICKTDTLTKVWGSASSGCEFK